MNDHLVTIPAEFAVRIKDSLPDDVVEEMFPHPNHPTLLNTQVLNEGSALGTYFTPDYTLSSDSKMRYRYYWITTFLLAAMMVGVGVIAYLNLGMDSLTYTVLMFAPLPMLLVYVHSYILSDIQYQNVIKDCMASTCLRTAIEIYNYLEQVELVGKVNHISDLHKATMEAVATHDPNLAQTCINEGLEKLGHKPELWTYDFTNKH